MKYLNIDDIYLLVKPCSELGKKEKMHFEMFTSHSFENAKSYYNKLSFLLTKIINFPELISHISSTLSHFEDIRALVTSNDDRVFEMHELHEIKHFLYFYDNLISQLRNIYSTDDLINSSEKSLCIIPGRNTNHLFELLDIDKQNSPTFYLSKNYSIKLKTLKDEMLKLQAKKQKITEKYILLVSSKLGITKFEEMVTISRKNQSLLNKLLDSNYFFISDENFYNITLKLKKSKEIYTIDQEIEIKNQEIEKESQYIRKHLTEKIMAFSGELLQALNEVGYFDLLFAKAVFAMNFKCVIPKIKEKKESFCQKHNFFEASNIYDILLYNEFSKNNLKYQHINVKLYNKVNIITGSNMGGKTTILKTIGQIAMMVKLGLPVPAESASSIIFDNIFFLGHSTINDRHDLSSFGNEVHTLQNIINTDGQNLFLLDEFGRGTNPVEGQALFHSVMRFFSKQTKTFVVSVTHYNFPKNVANTSHFQMIGLKKEHLNKIQESLEPSLFNKLKQINKYMNYQPIEVSENEDVPMSAINIAELLGLEKEIICTAIDNLK